MQVNKGVPKQPDLAPVSAEELTTSFMRGMAVRNGVLASNLLPHPAGSSKTKSRRRRRTSVESQDSSLAPTDAGQRPPVPKKAKNGGNFHGSQRSNMQAKPAAVPSAPGETGYERVAKGPRKRSGRESKGGKSSPADLNPYKHGAQPVSLNTP